MRWFAIICTIALAACTSGTSVREQTVNVTSTSPAPPEASKGGDATKDRLPAEPSERVPKKKRVLVTMAAEWMVDPTHRKAQVVVTLAPAEGWHIYWLNPGDAGLATEFDLEQNGRRLEQTTRMPTPKRKVSSGDIVSFAFDQSTRFFLEPKDFQAAQPIVVAARWLACAETCIKGGATIDLPSFDRRPNPNDGSTLQHRRDWEALPVKRTMKWNKNQQMLVFTSSVGSTVALYPHNELFRRLDGHALPYCSNNRCQLPAAILQNRESDTRLWATMQIKNATSTKAYQTDIVEGYLP